MPRRATGSRERQRASIERDGHAPTRPGAYDLEMHVLKRGLLSFACLGLLTATILAVFYIPLFYVLVRRGVRDGIRIIRERLRRREARA